AGFNGASFYPCYGMAEATLLVSGGIKGRRPVTTYFDSEALRQNRAEVINHPPSGVDVRKLVSCGGTWGDQQIIIANPETKCIQPSGQVGEIWLKGSNIARGYWNQPRLTEEKFNGFLADTGGGPFFRTGDLGFLSKGHLYITGRQKDLIIIRGKNHYPQDIEKTVARCHEALSQGRGAAVAVEKDGSEELVIIQEVRRTFVLNLDVAAVCTAIRQAVAEKHGINAYAIALVKTGGVPKTTSGKIRRSESRKNFLQGTLSLVGQWQPEKIQELERVPKTKSTSGAFADPPGAAEIQEWLVKRLSFSTKLDESLIDIDAPFERLGADSLLAVQLTKDLGTWLSRRLSPTLLYDFPSVKALATYLGQKSTAQEKGPGDSVSHETEEDTVAIIGLSCRFPGAKDPDEFWEMLKTGKDAIRFVPPDRWDAQSIMLRFPDEKLSAIQWAGLLDNVGWFDPSFFGISPREAVEIDPQQRLLLEVSWEALERAGYAAGQLAGSDTGVFVGISSNDYARLQANNNTLRQSPYWATGNAFSIAANRLSYILDLQGPSLAIDTAC